jgi:hypothetical protein
MLSGHLSRRTTSRHVRELSDAFRARVGRVKHVEGAIAGRRGDTVTVRARIEGERMNSEPIVALVRESGEWSIASASDVLATDDATSPQRLP